MIITGNSDEFYDMIIEFHDAVYKDQIKEFIFRITLLDSLDESLFQDFLGLINDIVSDFGVKVTFEVKRDENRD